MNTNLERVARDVRLDDAANERLRLEFGHACARRVAHLVEQVGVADCLAGLGAYLQGTISRAEFERLATKASHLATAHEGSKSLDGCGHAAVSATYAVARALSGNALQAAGYAAYAAVYGQGGHGAVSDRESFEPEFEWQVRLLESLARTGIRAA